MALSANARIIFTVAEASASLKPTDVQYVRADTTVLGFGTIDGPRGMPGTPTGGSLIGAIGSSASPLLSAGGILRVLATRINVPSPPTGENGFIAACIVDGGPDRDPSITVDQALGPNGGTGIDVCLTDRGWFGMAAMNCDHGQVPVLDGGTSNGWESVVTGTDNGIASYTRGLTFEPCTHWTIGFASTFCRAAWHFGSERPGVGRSYAEIIG